MTPTGWTPTEARAWLTDLQRRGMLLGLDRVERVAASLGHPERVAPAVLIAGTNGKGSVAALLDAILCAAGLRTGRYTSDEVAFARALGAVHDPADREQATPFEALTLAAFWHFREQQTERNVVEVGLGGRLDATRLCAADLTVVTSRGPKSTWARGPDPCRTCSPDRRKRSGPRRSQPGLWWSAKPTVTGHGA